MTASTTTATTAGRSNGQSEGLSREILVLAGVVILGTIMTVLDLTVVNVAIPTLARDLGASIPRSSGVHGTRGGGALAVIPALMMPRRADGAGAGAGSSGAADDEQAKAA